jgi:hypothetical protein
VYICEIGGAMSLRNIVRKILLCFVLGGHSVLGIGISKEEIEEILHAMNQTKVEVTISEEERKGVSW